MGKKFKIDFLENLSSDVHEISDERTRDPPPELGAGQGAPNFGVTPKNLPLPVFGGRKFLHD